MAQTTTEEQYKRLRQYLTPYMKGKNVDAVLYALAEGSASYLVNNVQAVNDMLYIVTASERYLDERLADVGITRPPSIGLSDDIFREIGIQIKNRKQVRDLINALLNAIFGDEFVRANSASRAFEPYNLESNVDPSFGFCSLPQYGTQGSCTLNGGVWTTGSTLKLQFDSGAVATVALYPQAFQNFSAATAQEVADAITKSLRNQGLSGTAIAKNDGSGPYVELLSDTIGPASSVTVFGGSAQNVLKFDAPVFSGNNAFTQWTLDAASHPGGFIRFVSVALPQQPMKVVLLSLM
jgi:hypothetical protein